MITRIMTAAVSFLLLVLVLVASVAAQVQFAPNQAELVQQRIAQLREKFLRKLPDGRSWRKLDEEATVEAIFTIIKEERQQPRRGALYHQALEEMGHYPDNNSAVKTLVENIDTGVPPGPRFTVSPLEGYTAAETLVKCGTRARRHILDALSRSQSERNLYLLAYVLVQLDQDQGHFDVDLTVLRLNKEIKYLEAIRSNVKSNEDNAQLKNLRHVIAIIQDPGFKHLTQFPPPEKEAAKPH